MAINEIKALSYGESPLMLEITIAGLPIDVNSVAGLDPISTSLDYPELSSYIVGQTTLTLIDENGLYAPNNANNFFATRTPPLPQDGVGVDVEIKAGYETHRITLLKGKILDVIFDSVVGLADIIVTNALHDMHRKQITDFGLDKRFRIVASEEESLNGVYPIAEWVLPVSDESVDVYKNTTEQLTEVPELRKRGQLDSDNFAVTTEGIETEGDKVQNPAMGYPQVDFKAPYRHRKVSEFIDDLLDEVNITNKEITLPDVDLPDHFSSNGRIGYQSIGTSQFGTSNEISWLGYTTDGIYENGKFYFLRNPRRGDLSTRAALIEHTEATGVERVLYRAPASTTFVTEFWKLAKDGNDIAILATDAFTEPSTERDLPGIPRPADGSYDATEPGNRSYIFFFNITNNTTTVRVPKTSSLQAQLGHYYIFGQTYGDYRTEDILTSVVPQSPPNMLPDTRHNFMWHSGLLYYIYVTLTHVGVARVGRQGTTSSISSYPLDEFGNKGGLDFDISGGNLYTMVTYKEPTRSRLVVFSQTL